MGQIKWCVCHCGEEKKKHAAGRTLKQNGTIMPDFPRPQFYNELYEMWGLQTGEVLPLFPGMEYPDYSLRSRSPDFLSVHRRIRNRSEGTSTSDLPM